MLRKKMTILRLEWALFFLEMACHALRDASDSLEYKTLELKTKISTRQQALMYQERLRLGN